MHKQDQLTISDPTVTTLVERLTENQQKMSQKVQAIVNCNSDLAAANNRYVMRITGDNAEGKAQLDNFIDPESIYPVIACTSRLMTTGVDAQTCKLIVLDRSINSMTEFKQIIGRGTRLFEGKHYFTVIDFVNAYHMFNDPEWDGVPLDPVVGDSGGRGEPEEEDGN